VAGQHTDEVCGLQQVPFRCAGSVAQGYEAQEKDED